MKMLARIISIVTLAFLSSGTIHASADKGKVNYWIRNYKEVKEGPLFNRTMEVFRKVLASADRRKGVEPRVHIIDYDGLPWAQSLEDGSIVLTRKAVEFCLRAKEREVGDARLAFVLGHELAHQLNADFWTYRFAAAAKNNPELGGVKEYASSPSAIKAMELQADQYGIIYAALAGYRTDVIASNENKFFKEWFKAVDPSMASLSSEDPSIKQREAAVLARLNDVTAKIEFFHAGVIAYHLGWYRESIALFEEFLKYYAGREVYHNIGTAYLGMAVKDYRLVHGTESVPFYLSIEIDPSTRADEIEIGREDGAKTSMEYRNHIDKAIEYLKKASESDPYYVTSRINLGAAYILDERYYNALSELEEAAKIKPEHKGIVNNRAVAHFLIGEMLHDEIFKERAFKDFEKAASGACGGPFKRNLSIAGRMLGKAEDEAPAGLEEDGEEFTIPDVRISQKAGNNFTGEGFKNLGDITVSRDLKIGLYQGIKSDEVVLVKNGVIKAAYREAGNQKFNPKRRGCNEADVVVERDKGKGIDLTRNTVFIYHK